MSGHTPGPWFVGEMISPKAPAVIGDGDSVVAMLPGDWNGCTYIKADHRLIASAPELLFALRALLRRAKDELADPQDVHEVAIAEDAIARATGAAP